MIRRNGWLGTMRVSRVACLGVAVFALSVGTAFGSTAHAVKGHAAAVQSLNVTIGAATPLYPDLFIAQTEGFFKKAGVTVNISNNGTGLVPVFLSGRADILVAGPSSVLPYVAQGQNIKVIYATNFGTTNGFPISTSSSISSTLGLGGGSTATFGVGESLGDGKSLSAYLVKHGAKPINVLTLSSATGNLATAIVAGTVTTALLSPGQVDPYIAKGLLKWAPGLAPGSQLMSEFDPPNIVGTGAYEVFASTIKSKATAINRFVVGVRLADEWLIKHNPAQIAAALIKNPVFIGQTVPNILTAVKQSRPGWAVREQGFIPKVKWNASLNTWGGWSLGTFDVHASTFGYSNMVDMTPWNNSTKLLKKIK